MSIPIVITAKLPTGGLVTTTDPQTVAGQKTFTVPILGDLHGTVTGELAGLGGTRANIYTPSSTEIVDGRISGDHNERVLIRADGTIHVTNGDGLSPAASYHYPGLVAAGNDAQMYFEMNRDTASLLTLSMARLSICADTLFAPGTVALNTSGMPLDSTGAWVAGGSLYITGNPGFPASGTVYGKALDQIFAVAYTSISTDAYGLHLAGTTSTFTANVSDPTYRHLFFISDGIGAPILWVDNIGGQHTTDEITMQYGVFGSSRLIGMAYLQAANRLRSALTFGAVGASGINQVGGARHDRRMDPYKLCYIRHIDLEAEIWTSNQIGDRETDRSLPEYSGYVNDGTWQALGISPELLTSANWYYPSGYVARPSISFAQSPGTGLSYLDIGANAFLRFSIGPQSANFNASGAQVLLIADTGATFFNDGSAASPVITFQNDVDTGLYRSSLGFATSINGVKINEFSAVGMTSPVVVVTAAGTTALTKEVTVADATAGNQTFTLPLANVFVGQRFTVKRKDNTGNTATMATTSSQTIDGAAPAQTLGHNNWYTFISDGSGWQIIGAGLDAPPVSETAWFTQDRAVTVGVSGPWPAVSDRYLRKVVCGLGVAGAATDEGDTSVEIWWEDGTPDTTLLASFTIPRAQTHYEIALDDDFIAEGSNLNLHYTAAGDGAERLTVGIVTELA